MYAFLERVDGNEPPCKVPTVKRIFVVVVDSTERHRGRIGHQVVESFVGQVRIGAANGHHPNTVGLEDRGETVSVGHGPGEGECANVKEYAPQGR